jgi:hypothetical protein
MSSLLEQAIADAKMLKETARKNAEAQILEQYSEEIKQSVEALLEQDETGLGDLGGDATATATPAASEQKQTPAVKKVMDSIQPAYLSEGDLQEIEIDLNSLVEKVTQLEEEMQVSNMPQDTMQVEEEPLEEASEEGDKQRAEAAKKDVEATTLRSKGAQADVKASDEKKKEEEKASGFTMSTGSSKMSSGTLEEQEFTLDEELMMDMENVRDPDNTEIELNKQKKIAAALEAQKDELLATVEKKEEEKSELEEALDAAIAKLSETKTKLKKSLELNVQLKEGVEYLTEKVSESNLLNARLLYTNKTLGNSSLNERQKNQIAESISRASSVEEAKTIYSTLLKSTASVSEKRSAPQSLTEALNKGPSPFLPRKQTQVDPTADRWKLLAGIKK